MRLRSICVFCGSSRGALPEFIDVAQRLGEVMVARNLDLVYGGGNVGLMAEVANAVLKAGGRVIGVIPEALMRREVGHGGVTELRVVASMHERKALMAELADAFVALPGGLGTLEELFEVLTWAQLGIHQKACGLLNVANYYDPLLTFLDRAVEQRFVRAEHRQLLRVEEDPERLFEQFACYQAPTVDKWLDSAQS